MGRAKGESGRENVPGIKLRGINYCSGEKERAVENWLPLVTRFPDCLAARSWGIRLIRNLPVLFPTLIKRQGEGLSAEATRETPKAQSRRGVRGFPACTQLADTYLLPHKPR